MGYPATPYNAYGSPGTKTYGGKVYSPSESVFPPAAPTSPPAAPSPKPSGAASTPSATRSPSSVTRPAAPAANTPSTPRAPATTIPPIFLTIQSEVVDEVYVIRLAQDDGDGHVLPVQDDTGTVNYATGAIYFPPEMLFGKKDYSSTTTANGTGSWNNDTTTDTFDGAVTVTYRPDTVTATSFTETLPALPLEFSLTPYTSDSIVPGTVRFTIGSTVYDDFEGVISHSINPSTGIGTIAGTIDYGTGDVTLTNWVAGPLLFSVQSLATFKGQFIDTKYDFRTISSPLKPNGFQIAVTALDGEPLTGEADLGGAITGDAMIGSVDVEYGRVRIEFGALVLDSALTVDEKLEEWYDVADVDVDGYIWKPRQIIPQTGRYNTTVYSYLPLSANLLGLDPVRLPMDGRVPTCRAGDSAILHYTDTLLLPNPVLASSVHDLEQTSLARVWIKDANNITVAGEKYTANLDTGIITFAADLSLAAYNLPLTAHFMIADEALVTDIDISGFVMLGRSILHDFPLGSYLSTEIRIGDMGGRVTVPFAQGSWSSVWSDILIGTATTAKFANNLYPIVTTNDGAIQERWRIQFVSSTTVNLIGETVGQLNITPLSILEVLAPINPVTSTPYFTIPIEGWGSGWISGNLLRFNTISADYPIDVLRCVKMGPATGQPDRIGLEFLGDVDA